MDITIQIFSPRSPNDISPVVMSFVPELNATVPPVDRTDAEFIVSANVIAESISSFQPNDLITNGSLIVSADVFDSNGHKVGTNAASGVLTILQGGTANRRYKVIFKVTSNWGNVYERSAIQEVKFL